MRFTRPGILTSALLFIFCVSLGAASADVCTEGLTNYWKFDEASGPIFGDSVGEKGAVCVAACPESVPGRIGNAAQFHGAEGLDVGSSPSFNWSVAQSFSVEFWMKSEGSCSGNQVVVGRNDSSIHWWAGCWTGGVAGFVLQDRNGNIAVLKGNVPITDGQWHHIAATHDVRNNTVNLYVDAGKNASITQSYSAGFESPTADLNIGWLALDSGYHYTGAVDELGFYNIALSEDTIRQHYLDGTTGLKLGYCGCSSALRIMPVGDSITLGRSDPSLEPGGPYEPPSNSLTGYRRQLYLSLAGSGYLIDFVGSRKSGSAVADMPWDVDHQGEVKNGGFTAQDLAGNVYNYLSANPADIVLLHIGTNNLNNPPYSTSAAVLSTILDEIYRYNKDITVVLALIINADTSVDPFIRATISEYNRNVAAMAETRIARGDRIILVDQENALTYPDDMYDKWHPNASGYAKMAEVWFNALRGILPVCTQFAPTITSAAVTDARVGRPYKYDVSASGSPVPNYRLVNPPVGMSIDTSNGLVQWIPDTSGAFTVTLQAANSLGTAVQTFEINVAEAPACPAGMMHYWKLDETGGKSYADFFGLNDAACTNCPVPVKGVLNGAQRFGAINRVNVPDDNTFDWAANDSFSLEFWMKTDPGNTCQGNQVMIGRDDKTSELHWWVGCWSGGKAGFVLKNKTGDIAILKGRKFITDGQWHLIAATRDGVTNEVSLYVDGAKETSALQNYSTGFDSKGTSLNIGWLNLDSGYNYSGLLDEIAAYNKRLPDQEISQHYWDGVNGFGYCEQASYPPIITSTPIVLGTVEKQYQYTVEAAGGPAPVFSLSTAPMGMKIDAVSGTISWSPTASGIFPVIVKAGNGIGADATQSFSIFVTGSSNSAPVIVSVPVTNGTVGQSYQYDLKATGTPAPVYQISTGPMGMTIDAATGVIHWTPSSPGRFEVVLHAANGAGSVAAQTFAIVVSGSGTSAPMITSRPVTSGVVGSSYRYQVKAAGNPGPTYSLATAPGGMTIDETTGLLSWTPSKAGSYKVIVRAANGMGAAAAQTFSIAVR